MTKKFFQGLFAFFVAAVLSVGFVSCKDDDETPSPGNPSGSSTSNTSSFSIVGKWMCEWDDGDEIGYDLITFNSNGTGAWQEFVYENGKSKLCDYEYFDYVFDSKTSTLKCLFGDEIEIMRVEVFSSNKVIVDGDIYIRQ